MSTVSLLINLSKIRATDGKVLFTYSEICKLPEWPEGPLIEIYRGDIFNVPSPNIEHQRITKIIEKIIDNYVEEDQLGEVFQAPIDVKFAEEDVAIPDLFFISKERKNIVKEKFIDGSPDLIIEIVSTNRKHDYVDKKIMYECYSVKEYWIIDPDEKIITIHYLENEKFTIKKEFRQGQRIESKVLSKIVLDVPFD